MLARASRVMVVAAMLRAMRARAAQAHAMVAAATVRAMAEEARVGRAATAARTVGDDIQVREAAEVSVRVAAKKDLAAAVMQVTVVVMDMAAVEMEHVTAAAARATVVVVTATAVVETATVVEARAREAGEKEAGARARGGRVTEGKLGSGTPCSRRKSIGRSHWNPSAGQGTYRRPAAPHTCSSSNRLGAEHPHRTGRKAGVPAHSQAKAQSSSGPVVATEMVVAETATVVTVRVGVATEAAVAATAEREVGVTAAGVAWVKVGVAKVKAVAATEAIAGEVRGSGIGSAQTTQNIAQVPHTRCIRPTFHRPCEQSPSSSDLAPQGQSDQATNN